MAVPTHFYKIIVDANDPSDVQALAFIIPNENLSWRQYGEFLTSIDAVESLTGLDFLSNISDEIESSLENSTAESVW